MMTHRGLTMIEMLMALVLLTGIVLAVASWITLAGQLGSRALEPMRRQAVVEAVFVLIYDDLVSGDFHLQETQRGDSAREEVRVRADDNSLEIDTRGGGGQAHVYRLDHSARRLERSERSNGLMLTRSLMTDVSEFKCAIDPEKRELEITLEVAGADDARNPRSSTQIEPAVRRFRLP